MRRLKFQESDSTKEREVINSHRASPLRINKDSHAINKPSSVYHQVNSATNHGSGAKRPAPVIIYTESPKIIHTHAHEFMTLVQKLTGLNRAKEEVEEKDENMTSTDEVYEDKQSVVMIKHNEGWEENESSVTEEKFVTQDLCAVSSMCEVSSHNPCLMDTPFFIPTLNDFMCSSSLKSNSMFQSPNHLSSPSFMDFSFIRALPDY